MQHVRALYAVCNIGSAPVWARTATALHGVWSARIFVRKKYTAEIEVEPRDSTTDAIGIEHSWGAAVYMGKGFEFRVTQHFLFDRLGARDRNLGPADQGNNGPWGRYMTVGVRKSFGTRRW